MTSDSYYVFICELIDTFVYCMKGPRLVISKYSTKVSDKLRTRYKVDKSYHWWYNKNINMLFIPLFISFVQIIRVETVTNISQ